VDSLLEKRKGKRGGGGCSSLVSSPAGGKEKKSLEYSCNCNRANGREKKKGKKEIALTIRLAVIRKGKKEIFRRLAVVPDDRTDKKKGGEGGCHSGFVEPNDPNLPKKGGTLAWISPKGERPEKEGKKSSKGGVAKPTLIVQPCGVGEGERRKKRNL